MGFRLAPCLVLWDFKTDGWPRVPIPKPSPQPRPIGLSCGWLYPCCGNGLMGFRLAPCPVGISKLTDGPLSRSQSLPHSRDPIGLSCSWLYPCCGNGLMGFRLAPCLALWDFKTDGWPPVPIPKPSPQPRPHWIELQLALPMLRQWFDGISAGTLSGFRGFQS